MFEIEIIHQEKMNRNKCQILDSKSRLLEFSNFRKCWAKREEMIGFTLWVYPHIDVSQQTR